MSSMGTKSVFARTVKGLGHPLRLTDPARRRNGFKYGKPCAVLSTPAEAVVDEVKAVPNIVPVAESLGAVPTQLAGAKVIEEVEQENALQRFWRTYNQLLDEKPIMVKSMTSFFGFMIGDICAQTIVGDPYSAARTLHLVMFGVLMDGPCGHMWYTTLDKNIFPEQPTSTKAIVTKTALDQLIWGPLFCCVFFAFIRTLEGHPDQVIPTIQEELIPTILSSYVIWPLAHLINFRFIPSQQRILYINAVQIVWTAFLSNLAANGHASLFQH
ncbi:hypothetical protein BSKO_08810 [Bryopsis sp. KO-2023]|nr:hypothetical protein BSKO_08810 [Bryopsis sp. KO-2023]